MNRSIWLLLLGVMLVLASAGCGDDGGSMMNTPDGGSFDGLRDDLDDLGDDLSDLSDTVDENKEASDTTDADHDDRLTDLETPISCSEEDKCIPDGVEIASSDLMPVVEELCGFEVDCCSEDELHAKFGAGIRDVDSCVATFSDLVNNGMSPGFFGDFTEVGSTGWAADAIEAVITYSQALNDEDVRVSIDDEAVSACVEQLSERDCPTPSEAPDGEVERCTRNFDEEMWDACHVRNLLVGHQEEGEICGYLSERYNLYMDECGEGLTCVGRGEAKPLGICAPYPEEGDRCREDSDCDGNPEADLYCYGVTGECTARGQEGDDCSFVDPDLEATRTEAMECTDGTYCNPDSLTCVAYCTENARCDSDADCPESMICNAARFDFGVGFPVCTDPVAAGEACTSDSECESGRCMDDPETDAVDRECAPAAANGEACDPEANAAWQCESYFCNADEVCAASCGWYQPAGGEYEWMACPDGQYCNAAAGTVHTNPTLNGCADLIEGTAACGSALVPGPTATQTSANPHDSCAEGRCDQGSCAADITEGNGCTESKECAEGMGCSTVANEGGAMQCTAAPSEAGDPCDPEAGLECPDDLECIAATNTCRELGEDGADCESAAGGTGNSALCAGERSCIEVTEGDPAFQCWSYGEYPQGASCGANNPCLSRECDLDSEACTAPLAEGDTCDPDAVPRCGPDLYCMTESRDAESGTCATKGIWGEPCRPRYSGADCLGGFCSQEHDAYQCSSSSIPMDMLVCDGE